jgi:chemotaxis protein MotB
VRTALLLGLSGLGSCVAQEKYQEALDTAKLYQRMVHDLEQYQGELEAEVDELRRHGTLRGAPVETSFMDPIDERLEELRRLEERIAGIGEDGDVTMVTFDGGFGFRLRDSVLFDSGSAELRPAGKQVIEALARDIGSQSYHRIWVRGHTDTDRIVRKETLERFPRGNLELSAARAVSVASVLNASSSVDSKRVVVAGFGPNDPVAANDTADSKQRNRRVEIFVEQVEGGGGS